MSGAAAQWIRASGGSFEVQSWRAGRLPVATLRHVFALVLYGPATRMLFVYG